MIIVIIKVMLIAALISDMQLKMLNNYNNCHA